MRGKTRTDAAAPAEHPSSIAERTMPANIKHRLDTRLEIFAGEPDLEALRLVACEWLVPVLVEKFLHEQGIELCERSNTELKKISIPRTR
jgi:hypothetical protein